MTMVPNPRRRGARRKRPFALGPAHRESLAVGRPADIDATRIRRERSVFSGVGSELVERSPMAWAVAAFRRSLRLWMAIRQPSAGHPLQTYWPCRTSMPQIHSAAACAS